MFGIILIYWVGKYFYQLAEKYNQNKWLFAFLGVVVYYVGQAIIGLTLGLMSLFFGFEIDWDNSVLMALLGIPAGAGSVYLVYILLEKKWKKEEVKIDSIQDIGQSEID
ncbi:hypothetical protein [Flavobacterium sp. U410]